MIIDNVEDKFIILEAIKMFKTFIKANKRKIRKATNLPQLLHNIDNLIILFENDEELKNALKEVA